MNTVYMVMEMTDDEYGTYEVYGVYGTYEKACSVIEQLGNEVVKVWFNENGLNRYTVEKWNVQ